MASQGPASKEAALQQKVDGLTGQLVRNIQALDERGQALDQLQDKSEALQSQANQFVKVTEDVRKTACWDLWKMRILIIVVVLIIAAIAGGIIAWQATK